MSKEKQTSPLSRALKAERQNLFRNGRYLFHILIWILAFLYLSFSIFGDDFKVGFSSGIQLTNAKDATDKVPLAEYSFLYVGFLSLIVAAIMVYSFLLFFIPYARYKKRKFYLWVGILSNVSFWFLAVMTAALVIGYKAGFQGKIDKHDILISAMLSTIFSGIIAGYFFALYYFINLHDQQKYLKVYKTALTERIEAETAFLLNQINPHFLFNTLNNIYSLLLSHSEEAIFATKELQQMMQYMLEECNKETVPLQGEIEFLRNYINLEKLRNQKDQIKVHFFVTGNPEGKTIAPLLLINFLENAFKHGVKAGFSEAYVNVKIDIRKDTIVLEMENSKPPLLHTPDKSIAGDGGIGIKNVKRRLDILYPRRYKLNIQDTPNQYLVLLSINLQQP